MKKMTG